jgi:hypothetical protein
MHTFIASFRALREAQREARLQDMEAFLYTFEATHRRIWRSRVDFNVFRLLGVRSDEMTHSAVLAWLLRAESGHGEGDKFMGAFAELCSLDIPDRLLDRYTVRTECVGAESIIDVMVVRRGEFLVYLENKVYAPEGHEQVDREFRDMRRLGASLKIPEHRQFAVFLTPHGRLPSSGDSTHWRTVSYGDLASAFAELLPSISTPKVKVLLHDWVDAVSTFGGTDELVV